MAALRRSLSEAPNARTGAYPYVERFLGEEVGAWQRKSAYLVAGLWALSRATEQAGDVGQAAARLSKAADSTSVEKRFLALLDADAEQLPNRLRQMIALMSSHGIAPDWHRLRRNLLNWNHPDRFVQERWAISFYAQSRKDEQQSTATETGTDAGEKE